MCPDAQAGQALQPPLQSECRALMLSVQSITVVSSASFIAVVSLPF